MVETTLILLFNADVPVHHWGDAVLMACFLINRMPFSTLDNKIPISIISPREPLYHVPPCIFGCTCFVHDVSPSLDCSMQRQSNVFFLGTLIFRKGIDAILQKLGSTTCLLMLLSLKKLLSSHPLSKISTQYNRSYLSRPSAQ